MHATADIPTVAAALRDARRRLERAGIEEPRRNAELLLASLLGTDSGGLLVRRDEPLEAEAARRYARWVGRRERREPLQHITGVQEFYALPLRVDRSVLVPRPETEGVVDAALGLDLPQRAHVADLGTGSGCLAIALAVNRRDLRLYALDSSERALETARRNARRHRVQGRIDLRAGDLGRPPEEWLGAMDLVVSNPPYVSEADWAALAPEVRDYDPREALVAGPTGLEAYQTLAPAAYRLLRPEGSLILELGFGQAEAVSEIVAVAGFRRIDVRPDLAGIPRVLLAERP